MRVRFFRLFGGASWVAAWAIFVGGCAQGPSPADRGDVDGLFSEQSGLRLGDEREAGKFDELGGPLSEERAVDLALLNNAAFAEQMAELDLAAADLVQAGLIANPDLAVLFPTGPKQLEATLSAPLEALWLRDRRMEMSRLLSQRAAARLTQGALDLVRDVRVAYAEAALAKARLALLEESSKLREQVLSIAEARVRAGEAVPLDAATARVDALRARQDAAALVHEVAIAQERLRALMGAGEVRTRFETVLAADPVARDWDADALVKSAVERRADMVAAALAVQAAQQRSALARIDWFTISFLADANERGSTGFEAGPGIRFVLPIFNQNQGAIALADAQLKRAQGQQRTLHDRIILEVRQAHARHAQAVEEHAAWRDKVVPALQEALKLAQKAYQNGDTPLLQVLDINRQLLDAQIRSAQAGAEVRKARAELERSAGQRLGGSSTTRREPPPCPPPEYR